MRDLVRKLGTSHTGFFHQSVRRVPARLAIGATFSRVESSDGVRWVACDVHEGGPAASAGLKSGDILKALNGKPILPPDPPMFAMGADLVSGYSAWPGRIESANRCTYASFA
jgi:hypothetical protein